MPNSPNFIFPLCQCFEGIKEADKFLYLFTFDVDAFFVCLYMSYKINPGF